MTEEKNFTTGAKETGTKISPEEALIVEQVLEAVRQIKFGFVQITIQDGRVIQIDRTEKKRFDRLR